MEEKDTFTFMEENVMASKKPKRKFVRELKKVVLYSVVFGIVGGSAFTVANGVISELMQKKDKEQIALESTVKPTVDPTQLQIEKNKKDDVEKITLDVSHMEQMYELVGKQAQETNQSIVGISDYQEEEEIPLLGDDVAGYIVAKTKDNIMVLTRYSEVKGTKHFQIRFFDEGLAVGSLYSYDKRMNLAIIKVPMKEIGTDSQKYLKILELGESSLLELGDLVYTTGQPNGTMYSMEMGYITGDMQYLSMEDYRFDLYSTNMMRYSDGYAIVCNMQGEWIGLMEHDYTDDSICRFVGTNKLKIILENLLNDETQVYAGVIAGELPKDYLLQHNILQGIYVNEVEIDSPVSEAGIMAGDVICRIDGNPIDTVMHFYENLQKYEPGDKVKFTVVRGVSQDRKEIEIEVELKERN
ncbi:MAG: serine protease [Lachnospiraceae bacterium]|nr:serine protease [Lachnospiraceae bacterium]